MDGTAWYVFPLLFFQAILFGGIEEIGWRYTFQPMLEEHMSYEMASVVTFLSWSAWHYMYFYITDSIMFIQHIPFLMGLLVNSFVLGAIYRVSKSLWLCVMYHCLVNTLSQTLLANDFALTVVCDIICIVLAIVWVRRSESQQVCAR